LNEITQIIEKNINHINFYIIEACPGRGSEDIEKECNSDRLEFFFLFSLFHDAMYGKITINSKELH
jgi:hypothetical protein